MAKCLPENDVSLKLRTVILNARKPIILRKFNMNWKCFDQPIEKWCLNYDKEMNALTEFEIMACNQGNTSPHWERCRGSARMTLSQFLQIQSTASAEEFWIGLNYQRINDLPAALKQDINFSNLGFTEASSECNYWLCSSQTNTPCHYDTYGCNIVVQVYGKKSWLLFPPGTPLASTRIPYEESSVYCQENFFAPSAKELEQLLALQNSAHRCILEAGDVLIVPRHWWHYVEAIDVSLSINYWVPLENDLEDQLEECIVKILIEHFITGSNTELRKYVLNPNQLDDMKDDCDLFEVLNYLYEKVIPNPPESKYRKLNVPRTPYQYLDETQYQSLLNELPAGAIEFVSPMPQADYEHLMIKNSKRCELTKTKTTPSLLSSIKETLINSVCTPAVVKHIKSEFLKRYTHKLHHTTD